MSSNGLRFADQFRASPELFAHMLDVAQDRLLLVPMAEKDFREASFLDQRLLSPERPRQWMTWEALESVSAGLPDTAQFIFHIGHVGSTLISRLLGELPEVLALREPLLLRAMAELHRLRGAAHSPWAPGLFEHRLAIVLGWLSRTYRPGQQTLVKATSFASELAGTIVASGRRALFLYVAPQVYVQSILAGEASRQELAVLSGDRLVRLHRRIGEEPWKLWAMSAGERAAMAWACEMTALDEAASAGMANVMWLDFEDFLAAPKERLIATAAHFGHSAEGQAEALVAGPIMSRYSKAPEHAYSAELRATVLAQAREEHRDELQRAEAWLEAAGSRYEAIARALARAGREG